MSVIITWPCQTCFFELDHSESPVICKKCGAEIKVSYDIGREAPQMSTERDKYARSYGESLSIRLKFMNTHDDVLSAFKAGWDAREDEVKRLKDLLNQFQIHSSTTCIHCRAGRTTLWFKGCNMCPNCSIRASTEGEK